MKIGSVVVDCEDFEGMLAFWQEALHYVTLSPATDGWVILRDPEGKNTSLSLNRVPAKVPGRNTFHFDLYTADQQAEVERLLRLGAVRHSQEYEPGDDFIVLEGPDGNLFCVVDTSGR